MSAENSIGIDELRSQNLADSLELELASEVSRKSCHPNAVNPDNVAGTLRAQMPNPSSVRRRGAVLVTPADRSTLPAPRSAVAICPTTALVDEAPLQQTAPPLRNRLVPVHLETSGFRNGVASTLQARVPDEAYPLLPSDGGICILGTKVSSEHEAKLALERALAAAIDRATRSEAATSNRLSPEHDSADRFSLRPEDRTPRLDDRLRIFDGNPDLEVATCPAQMQPEPTSARLDTATLVSSTAEARTL